MLSEKRLTPLKIGTIALVCLLGLWMACPPVLESGLNQVPGDPGDSRFVNYCLEHTYRWIKGDRGFESFWDAGFFYPMKNTFALSDTMLGSAPLYWGARFAGFEMDTAFLLWILACLALCFWLMFIALNRGLGIGLLGSTAGAFLFAFSSSRIAYLNHQQLVPQFFSALGLWSLTSLAHKTSPIKTRTKIAVFFASFSLQLHAGFYLGWFWAFGLGIFAIVCLFFSELRTRTWTLLKTYPMTLCLSAALCLLSLYSMGEHYLQAAREHGGRSFGEVLQPKLQSWLFMGNNWLYSWMWGYELFKRIPTPGEQSIGIGLMTSALAFWGLFSNRNRKGILALLIASIVLASIVTVFPSGFTMWKPFFKSIPGANAIRALSRIGLLFLIPASLGLAFAIDRVSKGWGIRGLVLAFALMALSIAEQRQFMGSFDKLENRAAIAKITQKIDPTKCEVFFYTPRVPDPKPAQARWWEDEEWKLHIDAMWAQIQTGVPTLNGYTGKYPKQWASLLWDSRLRSAEDEVRVSKALGAWTQEYGMDSSNVCIILK